MRSGAEVNGHGRRAMRPPLRRLGLHARFADRLAICRGARDAALCAGPPSAIGDKLSRHRPVAMAQIGPFGRSRKMAQGAPSRALNRSIGPPWGIEARFADCLAIYRGARDAALHARGPSAIGGMLPQAWPVAVAQPVPFGMVGTALQVAPSRALNRPIAPPLPRSAPVAEDVSIAMIVSVTLGVAVLVPVPIRVAVVVPITIGHRGNARP